MILIDGATFPDNPDCDLSTGSEGAYPPFYLFDTGLQAHVAGPYPTRNAAEKVLSTVKGYAAPDLYFDEN